MHRTIAAPTRETAEAIAVQGLAFLAAEPARLSRFLVLTGLTPAQVRAQAQEPQFLAGVLEHLLADESLLLAFAANAALAPQAVVSACVLLQPNLDGTAS
jgi:hypothetical protein